MSERKHYAQLPKETFIKTLGQRYDESSGKDKFAYWVFITIVFSLITAGGYTESCASEI
jgi:hypothetical protein